MKASKHLSHYTKNAAAFESKTPLFSEDELRHLLENAPVSSPPVRVPSPNSFRRNFMIGSGLLAGAAAAFLLWNTVLPPAAPQVQSSGDQHTTAAAQQWASNSADLKSNSASSEAAGSAQTKRDNQMASGAAPATTSTATSAASGGTSPAAAAPMSAFATDNVPPAPASAQQNTKSLDRAWTSKQASIANTVTTGNSTGYFGRTNSVHVPPTIKGLHPLELSAEELQKLGLSIDDNGVHLVAMLGYDVQDPVTLTAFQSNSGLNQSQTTFKQTQLESVLRPFGYGSQGAMQFAVRIDSFDLRSVLQVKGKEPVVAPVLITQQCKDAQGHDRNRVMIFGNTDHSAAQSSGLATEGKQLFDLYVASSTTDANDKSVFPLLSKLVPVRILLTDANGVGSDVLLWYYPDSEFIKALPSSVGQAIQDEVDRVQSAEQRNTMQDAPPVVDQRERGDYHYLDVARSAEGDVQILSLGPNPAHEQSTVHYRLKTERTIKMVLYDMSGRQVAVLVDGTNPGVGDHDQLLDCHNLSSGAYLLCIVSNSGEQAVQRFIIQN